MKGEKNMNTKIRFFRKPVTTISWIAVLTAMALLLGIGANMLHSAQSLLDIIDQHHTTIAVQTLEKGLTPAGNWNKLSATLSEREVYELENLDCVKDVDMRMLTGAYIPELSARLALGKGYGTQTNYDAMSWDSTMNESYNEVILTGTVTHAWYEDGESFFYDISELGIGIEEPVNSRQYNAIVEIDEIIVANEEYCFFPTEEFFSYDGRVHVSVLAYNQFGLTEEEGQPGYNFFQPGGKYILCGTYNPQIQGEGPESNFPAELRDQMFPKLELGTTYNVPGESFNCTDAYVKGDTLLYHPHCLTEWDWEIPRVRYPGDKVLPCATRLTGTVEELLATDELWTDAVDLFEKTLHTFPVLGTEALETMYAFNRNEAVFIEGRGFTQEEYDAGAKVCVIEESIALKAGIKAGDTIHFSQFICGHGPFDGNTSLQMADDNGMLINPGVGRFPLGDGLKTEDEEFTVVGIYKLSRTWDTSSFAFTPNTIFVPMKAQIPGGYGGASTLNGSGDGGRVNINGTYGIFMTIVIENGRAAEFLEQAEEIVGNKFYAFDQGFEKAMDSVIAVEKEAQKLIGIASIGWLLLLTLYVLLYQNKERNNLGILRSLGGTPKQGRRYLFGSGFILAAVGIAIGTLGSSFVTRLVSRQLAEFMVSEGTMQTMSGGMELGTEAIAEILAQASLPISTLLTLSAAQLAVIAIFLWLHAAVISRQTPRKLMGV